MFLFRAGLGIAMLTTSTTFAGPPRHSQVVAAQKRNDLTAGGAAHRIGMLRQQRRVERLIEKTGRQDNPQKK